MVVRDGPMVGVDCQHLTTVAGPSGGAATWPSRVVTMTTVVASTFALPPQLPRVPLAFTPAFRAIALCHHFALHFPLG